MGENIMQANDNGMEKEFSSAEGFLQQYDAAIDAADELFSGFGGGFGDQSLGTEVVPSPDDDLGKTLPHLVTGHSKMQACPVLTPGID